MRWRQHSDWPLIHPRASSPRVFGTGVRSHGETSGGSVLLKFFNDGRAAARLLVENDWIETWGDLVLEIISWPCTTKMFDRDVGAGIAIMMACPLFTLIPAVSGVAADV